MTDSFWRYYEKHIDCDWCGRQTRGRVYKDRTDVSCGACDRQLKELNPTEYKIIKQLREKGRLHS